MKKWLVILSLSFGVSSVMHAQNMSEVEQQITSYIEASRYWRFQSHKDDTLYNGERVSILDPLSDIDQQLYEYISSLSITQPLILTYDFKTILSKDMSVTTSDDKHLRIFVWNTQLGIGVPGTTDEIVLYKADNKIKATQLGNVRDVGVNNDTNRYLSGPDYETITTISRGDKKYYLVVYTDLYSGLRMAKKTIASYSIEDGELKKAPIFVTKDITTSHIEYEYAINDDFEKMKEVHTVYMSKNGKKLHIPEVEGGQMTGKWQVYNFNGSKFVYDKTE